MLQSGAISLQRAGEPRLNEITCLKEKIKSHCCEEAERQSGLGLDEEERKVEKKEKKKS